VLAIPGIHTPDDLCLQGDGAGTAYSTKFLTGADFITESSHCAVLTGCSDGFVRLFDLRCVHHTGPDLQFRSHDGPLTGLAIRKSGVLATAYQAPTTSELHFSDIRMASEAPTTCACFFALGFVGRRLL
jgi:WD40 repeat protein